MVESPNKLFRKLSIEELDRQIVDGESHGMECSLERQLADTLRELAIYKGWEEGKQLIINQLETENQRLRSILQDYLSQQEGCPPSTIMNRMMAYLNRNKPTLPENPWQHGEEYVEPYQPKTTDAELAPGLSATNVKWNDL